MLFFFGVLRPIQQAKQGSKMAVGCTTAVGEPPETFKGTRPHLSTLTCTLKEQLPIAEPPHKGFVIFTPCHRQGVGLGIQAHTKHRRCPKKCPKKKTGKGMGLPPRVLSLGIYRTPTPFHPKQHVFSLGKEGCTQVLLSFKHQSIGETPPQGCQAPRTSPGQIPLRYCTLHHPALMPGQRGGSMCRAFSPRHGMPPGWVQTEGGEHCVTGSLLRVNN